MRAKSQKILAVVLDGTRAHFFKQGPAGRLTSPSEMESGKHEQAKYDFVHLIVATLDPAYG